MQRDNHDNRRAAVPALLQWAGLLVVLCIAALRMVTAFTDAVVFDIDPAIDPTRFAGLGPAGTLWLDVLLFSGAGLFFLGYSLERRAVDWIIITLALLPVIIVFWHGHHDLGDMRRGSVWVAGAVAAVVMAHARRDPAMRIVIIMVLAGIGGPLAVRGAANVTYEYADTLVMYDQQKDLILADKGWDENSSSALIYERRLEHREPTGWFATTNIFGSFMAASVVLWLGLGFAAVRAKLSSGWAGSCVIFAIVCATGVYMTDSAGALLACAAGVGLLGVLCITTLSEARLLIRTQRAAPMLAIGLVIAALAGVLMHGLALAQSAHANISLLFRWHYIISASRIFAHHPWVGVGPDEFQAEYMIERVAINPEEVASAHSMSFDWTATLGVVAVAWIGLVLYLLWRGRVARNSSDGTPVARETIPITPIGALAAIFGIAIFGVATALYWEWDVLDVLSGTMRIIGILGFCAAAAVAGHIAARVSARLINMTLLSAAVALLVHGQIEMTWTQPGSVVMAFVFLGAAATAVDRRPKWTSVLVSLLLFSGAAWLAVRGAIPATQVSRHKINAAEQLWPVAQARQAQISYQFALAHGRSELVTPFRAERDQALQQLGVSPPVTPLDWAGLEQLLKPVLIERRQHAGDILLEAYHHWPITEDTIAAASKQIGLASEQMQMPQRVPVLERAMELAEQSARNHRDIASASNAELMRLKMYELTGDHTHIIKAIEIAEDLTTQDPLGIRAWVTLGNVLWDDKQFVRAAEAYRKAIEHSDNFKFDELKQMPSDQRDLLELRIVGASNEG